MHVLGHGFSQRRRTNKPRDLHIRKVSVSGSSLSSSSTSMASTSSTSISAPSTAATSQSSLSRTSLSPSNSPSSTRRSGRSSAGLDPLALNPTFQPLAPPRLFDRPLLQSPEHHRFDEPSTFFLDDDQDDEGFGALDLPEESSPVPEAKATEPEDYFGGAVFVSKRPSLPRSRWSESTVASVESTSLSEDDDDTVHGSEEDEALDDDDAVDAFIGHYYLQPTSSPSDGHQSMPNFSLKRETMPKRPPIKTLDSLEDFIKRGGWKRRGIVFNQEELDGDDEDAIHLF